MIRPHRTLLMLAIAALAASPLRAHFPWLVTDQDGRAVFFFGESIADRTYHLPDNLAAARVQQLTAAGEQQTLDLQLVDSDSLVGRRSAGPVRGEGSLISAASYGVYHGARLTYYCQHFRGAVSDWPTEPNQALPLQFVLATDPAGLKATLYWRGKPLPETEVKLFAEDGQQRDSAKSNAHGRVLFDTASIAPGLGGVMAGFVDKTDVGEVDGENYESAMHYVTATFVAPESISGGSESQPSPDHPSTPKQVSGAASIAASGLPELPETLTSFGGAIANGMLYVYGGHTGEAHSYSISEQSDRFYGLPLDSESPRWRKLPGGPRLQGLALVPDGQDVIRIGGFTALNQAGEDHDLQSQATVNRFDAAADSWIELPSLPEPRSSHDAAVLNRQLYVVGGWQLRGAREDSRWHDTAWTLALDDADANHTWRSIPAPPTTRRALSLAAHQEKLYAIGGMKQQGGPTTVVEIYDPATDHWTAGPALPGKPMNGFGNSSFSSGRHLYVTTIDGMVLRLSDDGSEWLQVATVDPPRFFHRLLPDAENSFLIVGGANMADGKYTHIDRLRVY